jgi:hypothetical protein
VYLEFAAIAQKENELEVFAEYLSMAEEIINQLNDSDPLRVEKEVLLISAYVMADPGKALSDFLDIRAGSSLWIKEPGNYHYLISRIGAP